MGQFIDLSNQKFNKLLVIKRVDVPAHIKHRNAHFLCLCECGNETIVASNSLKSNKIKSCGCLRVKDLTNQIFDKLTVITRTQKPDTRLYSTRDSFWICKCECGNEKVAAGSDLNSGKVSSCGCKIKFSSPEEAYLGIANLVFKERYDDGDLTFQQFIELSQQDCFYCGDPPSNCRKPGKGSSVFTIKHGIFIYNGLDRKDNELPHLYSNIVPCCAKCNWMKSTHSSLEFINHVEKIYKYQQAKI